MKLLDFGAARYSLGNVSRSLDVILKHGFAPYEQYSRRGKQGPFTDVYSLGATIYYALTGTKPDDAIERRDNDQTPLPTTLGARISNAQEAVVMRALAVMPNDRYQNIPQFRAAILAAKPLPKPKPKPEPTPEPKPKKKLPKWLLPGMAAVLAAVVGVGIWVMKPSMDYKAAQERMDAGEYDSAADTFDDLENYEDSAPKDEDAKQQAAYQNAMALLEAGEYARAAEAFEALGDYRDSSEKLTELIGNVSCTYEENEEGLTITGYGGSLPKAVILPRIISNQIVTEIGEYAFCGCTSLESITIPDSITSIEGWAFYDCASLESITIPNSVTSIEGWAFCGCTSLESITIPNGVTSPFAGTFERCASLKSVTIPDGVTSIGFRTLSGCTNLESVTIPDSVTFIDSRAFEYCTSLKSITIPNSVTSIGNNAFEGCTSLDSVIIPDSVTLINLRAFDGCTSLKNVTIPKDCKLRGTPFPYDCKVTRR